MFVWVFAACVEVAPTGRPFEAVRDEIRAPAASDVEAPTSRAPKGTFDFDAEDRPDEASAEGKPPSPEEAAAALGLTALPPGFESTARPPAAAPAAPLTSPPPTAAPAATLGTFPPPPANWGVRLVSTVTDAQPPRAILGLPNGKETVVVPGDLLPDARVVVLAIGHDAVQIAEITPAGDHATVQTYVMTAMFPSAASITP